jgi:hypothetical protein
MAKLRRFLLLLALAFSVGGFTFYASVVVPIGGAVLGKTTQGFVTRRVAIAINLSTVVMSCLLASEMFAGWRGRSRRANAVFAACIAIIAGCCIGLLFFHSFLESFLIENEFSITDPDRFYRSHRIYLWISLAQWMATLPVVWLIATEWRTSPLDAVNASD